MQSRRSGVFIAKLLLQTQHASGESKHLETVVSDALKYLGFEVRDLATPGEPEGIASAYPIPTNSTPTLENPNPPLYTFSFDAKSSRHQVAATGNISLDGVVEHRNRYSADYALVIAPGFSQGALATRCAELHVTPMTAHDLGRLLEYTVEYGAIPVTKIREVFSLHDPSHVQAWVDELKSWLTAQRPFTIDVFIRVLEVLRGDVPDALPAATIAYTCRTSLGAASVLDIDVLTLAKGLAVLVPDLIGVDGDKIIVNASSARVAEAIRTQLEGLQDGELEAEPSGEVLK